MLHLIKLKSAKELLIIDFVSKRKCEDKTMDLDILFIFKFWLENMF